MFTFMNISGLSNMLVPQFCIILVHSIPLVFLLSLTNLVSTKVSPFIPSRGVFPAVSSLFIMDLDIC